MLEIFQVTVVFLVIINILTNIYPNYGNYL